jgi:hypothetical protein
MAPVRSGVVPPRFYVAAFAPTVLAATVLGAAGCGLVGREPPRPDIAPNVARVDLAGRRTTVPLTACGREGDVVVLGGAEDGTVVQAQADLGDGGRDRSGVTLDLGDRAGGIWGAFGADMPDGPAGEITGVRVEGDLVVIEGTWVPLDGDLTPLPSPPPAEGELIARCPEDEDDVAAPGAAQADPAAAYHGPGRGAGDPAARSPGRQPPSPR